MKRKKLDEIKNKAKSSIDYMKKVENEYLTGKKLIDRENFVHRISQHHDEKEITYLLNDLQQNKKSFSFFKKGYFGIITLIAGSIITFIGMLFAGNLGILGNMSNEVFGKKLQNNETNIDDIISFLGEASGMFLTQYSKILFVILVLLFIILFFLYFTYNNTTRFIIVLKNAKQIRKYDKENV